jgi:hypothetical protein
MKSSRAADRPGWRLHLIGHDPETGAEIEMGGGLFPIEPNVGEKEAYADALETVVGRQNLIGCLLCTLRVQVISEGYRITANRQIAPN